MLVKFLRNRTLTFILQDQATNKIPLRTVILLFDYSINKQI